MKPIINLLVQNIWLVQAPRHIAVVGNPTHMVVMDARTQQVLIDQLFSVPKCVRLARMSERSYDLLAKIFRAVPKRSEGELQDVVGEEFLRLNECNVSEFQKQKASGALPTEFPP